MTANLRKFLSRGKTLLVPGAADALSARLIEAHGYECVYIGSYATAASRYGITDTGLLSLESLVEQARTIARAVRIPVIADAESGFEDPSLTCEPSKTPASRRSTSRTTPARASTQALLKS